MAYTQDALADQLREAVEDKSARQLARLLDQGLDPDVRRVGEDAAPTALILACANGWDKGAEALLLAGASVRRTDARGSTALLAAAWANSPKCVELLARHGADMDAVDALGEGALSICAAGDRLEAMEAAQKFGARVPPGKASAARKAIDAGSARCLRVALRAGESPDAGHMGHATLAHLCAARGDDDCMRALIEAGADLERADPLGQTAASVAAAAGREGCLALIQEAQLRKSLPPSPPGHGPARI